MLKLFFRLSPILFIFFFHEVSAQRHWEKRNGSISPWEIGLSAGVSTFVTSINPDLRAIDHLVNFWHREANPGLGVSLVRNLSPSLGIEFNWLTTRLTGSWNGKLPPLSISAGRDVPLTFNSQINQFDLVMAFNVNQILHPGNRDDIWHLYVKTGAGYAHIKDNRNFFPGDSPYTRFSLASDFGVSYSVSDKIKLLAGSTFRLANTDNLDGVHLESIDRQGQPVSNINVMEIYNYTYLRINYRIGDQNSKRSKILFKNILGNSGICR